MIDHMTLTVRDFARGRAFYEKALAPLGYRVLMAFEDTCGFGDEKPYLWMRVGEPPASPPHIAFVARRRADVDAFHAAALAAGATDNGAPGLRLDYHPSYYAAFVIDPDGYPIEAVNHAEPAAGSRRAAKRSPAKRASAKRAPAKRAGSAGKTSARKAKRPRR